MKEYFGAFREFKELYSDSIIEVEMYDMPFSSFYDTFPVEMDEIEFYTFEAQQCGKDILELCCGNGRITIPLAKKGFNVDGYDISIDMLKHLEEKANKLSKSVRKRINCSYGDIFNIEFKKKYDFIILPATTICILADDEEKVIKLFKKINSALKDDGSFVFDFRTDLINSKKTKTEIVALTEKTNSYKSLILYQEFNNYIAGRSIGNFYMQIENENGEFNKYITSTNKRIIDHQTIEKLAKESYFYISKKKIFDYKDYGLVYIVLKK